MVSGINGYLILDYTAFDYTSSQQREEHFISSSLFDVLVFARFCVIWPSSLHVGTDNGFGLLRIRLVFEKYGPDKLPKYNQPTNCE